MNHERVAWCFLRSSVAPAAVAEALSTYAPLGKAVFTANPDGLECSGPGFSVRIVAITKLRALLAEIAKIPRRQDELRQCSMVLAVDVMLDEAAYQGTIYGAKAPMGPELNALPWEAVGACEALNINLAASKPIVFDRTSGFYPSV